MRGYIFDGDKFGEDIVDRLVSMQIGFEECVVYSDHYNSATGIRNIAENGALPSIRGFLDLCNLLDLCPASYWRIDDVREEFDTDDIPF